MHWWQSIRVKMVRDLALAALLPLVLFALVSVYAGRQSLGTSARENLELLARVTATRLDQLLSGGLNLADTLARDERVVAYCTVVPGAGAKNNWTQAAENALRRRWRAAELADPDLAQITLLDRNGKGIASTNRDDINLDLSFRSYFKAARDGQRHISDVIIGKTTKRPGIYFAVPVRDAEPDAPEVSRATAPVVGVLFIKLQGEKLWEIIDGAQVGRDGYTVLIDEHGILLAHPRRDRIFKSLATLDAATVATIDPQTRFGSRTLETVNKPALWDAVRQQAAGATAFSMTEDMNTSSDDWVVGFRRLSGKPWRVLAVEPQSQFAASANDLRNKLLIAVAGVAVASVLFALWRARQLVRPTVELTDAANRLASGDFAARVTPHGHDELARLGAVFNDLGPKLKERTELARAMKVAVEVQDSLLPSKPPQIAGMELAGRSVYCDATGGDYYDFLTAKGLGDGFVLLAVGDVMGHGIGSALLMAATRAALWAEVEDAQHLADTLSRINRVLSRDARHHKFVTLQLCAIDPRTRTARWASAGHDPAIVYDPATGAFTELQGCGVPLGVLEDAQYENYETSSPLPPGAIIVIGTDGIWEAMSPANDQFEKDRLREVIRAHANESCEAIGNAIIASVKAWQAGGPATDDITLIVVRLGH